jgi:hypothetical protein
MPRRRGAAARLADRGAAGRRGGPRPTPGWLDARNRRLTVRFDDHSRTLLDLADARDGPVDRSCRMGVWHRFERRLVAGAVAYDPEPLDRPPAGSVLRCRARPDGDVALDA